MMITTSISISHYILSGEGIEISQNELVESRLRNKIKRKQAKSKNNDWYEMT